MPLIPFLLTGLLAADPAAAPAPPLRLDGLWILNQEGKPVPPRDFERGLQTSALLFRRSPKGGEPGKGEGLLWSIGDQRAEWPGHLLAIDPRTGKLALPPIRLAVEKETRNPLFAQYRAIPKKNPDFEGLALDPRDPSRFFGVTEDKAQWLVVIQLDEHLHQQGFPPTAAIEEIIPLEFPPDLKPFQDDLNYRLEGLALSDDGGTIYLAWERAADRLPRLFSLTAGEARSGRSVHPAPVPMDFASLPPRADKPKALLNLNDLQFIRRDGKPLLLAIARDQERVLVLDLEAKTISSWVDLDLRSPEGKAILWVSPEGLAIDRENDRLWLINDPDSIRGNYRLLDEAAASGNFAAMAPLLFETKLSTILAPRKG